MKDSDTGLILLIGIGVLAYLVYQNDRQVTNRASNNTESTTDGKNLCPVCSR